MAIDLIDRQEAAGLLGITVSRFRQIYETGRVTKYKNLETGRIRFDRVEVLRLVDERSVFHPSTPVRQAS